MNECVKTVLFGGQKQSLRQNEAIVNFVTRYLMETGNSDVSSEGGVVKGIQTALEDLVCNCMNGGKLDQIDEVLFLQYIVGMDAYEAIVSGVKGNIIYNTAGDKGKVVFDYIITDEFTASEQMMERNIACRENRENGNLKKSLDAEDEAWALINKIVNLCSPAERAELPADDALAAILLSKDYWKVFG